MRQTLQLQLYISATYSYSASTPSLEPSLTFLQLCCRDGTHSLLFFTYNFSFSLFHSSLQTDAQTLGTFPLNSAKRSNEVTIDESANATAPSASDDLEFAEEGDAVFMLTCQLLNMSLQLQLSLTMHFRECTSCLYCCLHFGDLSVRLFF